MPERKSGRQNDGKFRVFDGSGLRGGYVSPCCILDGGYYRGEAEKMIYTVETEADFMSYCIGGYYI